MHVRIFESLQLEGSYVGDLVAMMLGKMVGSIFKGSPSLPLAPDYSLKHESRFCWEGILLM